MQILRDYKTVARGFPTSLKYCWVMFIYISAVKGKSTTSSDFVGHIYWFHLILSKLRSEEIPGWWTKKVPPIIVNCLPSSTSSIQWDFSTRQQALPTQANHSSLGIEMIRNTPQISCLISLLQLQWSSTIQSAPGHLSRGPHRAKLPTILHTLHKDKCTMPKSPQS